VDSLGTRMAREAASSHGACSSEIVLTFNAEVTQRNFSGWELSAMPVSRTLRSQPSEGSAENYLAEWPQPEIRQRVVRLKKRVNKKMLAHALSIRG